MDENEQRGGEMARAAAHILTALATTGPKGAAVAAAEEAAPFLIKLAAGVLAFLLLTPMLVFAAVPNMFFGYEGSSNQDIAQMTQQAMAVGGAYISLEDIEQLQVDAIVSKIVEDYEDDDIDIDEVRLRSSFDREDLNWFIAINSIACRQDLDAISVDEIRSFCTARLSYEHSLSSMAALSGQAEQVLFPRYRDTGLARVFVLTSDAIEAATGRKPVPYSPPRTQFLTSKGDVVDAPLIQTHRKT